MVIQHLPIGVIRTTWRIREAQRKGLTAQEWLGIRELGTLEEDCLLVVDLANDMMSLLREWIQLLFVKLARLEEQRCLFVHVCRPGLVQNVVAYHIWVVLKFLCHLRPEGEHLVQEPIFV